MGFSIFQITLGREGASTVVFLVAINIVLWFAFAFAVTSGVLLAIEAL